MSSTRSGANVRAKRPTPQQEQSYPRPQSGPGPVTSINSQQIFNNSGANTTGANARISGPRGSTSSGSQQSQPAQTNDLLNPPQGSKLTIGNAVALITLRLGRLESFMHQYQLEDHHNDGDNNIMQSVLTRLSALEHKPTKDDGSNQLILNRLNALETVSKETTSKAQYKTYKEPVTAIASVPTVSLEQYMALQVDVSSLHEELRETKDLLLKLQSFTMETNAKLVNTIFCPIDQFDIQDFENAVDDINKYELDDCELHGSFENADEDGFLEEETDGESCDHETKSTTLSVNLKELISQELLGM